MALTLAKVDEVRELLAAGWSQRRTAREAQVSRGSVSSIFHGRWCLKLSQRREAMVSDEGLGDGPSGEEAAAIKARAREAAATKSPESIRQLFAKHGPPELDLRPDDRAGYIEIRKRQGRWPPAEEENESDPRAA